MPKVTRLAKVRQSIYTKILEVASNVTHYFYRQPR